MFKVPIYEFVLNVQRNASVILMFTGAQQEKYDE